MIIIYGRCSAIENYEKGSSIETQILKCKSYAITKDLIVDKVITEQVSGTIAFDKRVQGGEILNNLKSGDHIICSALDRFSRNTLDLLNLVELFKKNKVKIHFIDIGGEVTDSSALGGVFLKLLSVFSEFVSKQLGEKQTATKDRLRKQGKYLGGKVYYGWDLDENKNLIKCEKEQQIINQMKDLRESGLSYQKIADEITKTTRKKFVKSWVFKLLNRDDIKSMVEMEIAS